MSAQGLGKATGTDILGGNTGTGGGEATRTDLYEKALKTIDNTTVESTGFSMFHILTIGSIGASLALFFTGNKQAGIFVGLWPPTFLALKSVVDKSDKQ
ncbi:MAG: hypothetical protein QOG00_1897 [Pyrinomonadaceae bacterium]|nr:hypothetical protein [Pyrinomonadaceae bacterium]MDX6269743.1 hypothetical protein [Acidobacteriota bacterium]